MLRVIAGAIAGLVTWWVMVFVFDFGLRTAWPEYAAVEKSVVFTLPMMIARLSMSGVASVASGAAAAIVGRNKIKPALAAGVLLLLAFLPVHYSLWSRLPVWYHLTFLASLIVLSVLGGALTRGKATAIQPA